MIEGVDVRYIEGVPYYKFRARFRLVSGERRQRTYWSPGYPWVRTEVARSLGAEFGIENIKPQSVTLTQVTP